MIDALLRAFGLRTGRYTSPHLESRHRADQPGRRAGHRASGSSRRTRDRAATSRWSTAARRVRLTFFEMLTAMAFAAFADAPVDVAVVEVGLGGAWDATNVLDADVAVGHPDRARPHRVARRHASREIAAEKAGIIKRARR